MNARMHALLLGVVCAASGALYASESLESVDTSVFQIASINEEHVVEYQKTIARNNTYKKYIRLSAKIAMVAAAGYVLYSVSPWGPSTSPSLVLKPEDYAKMSRAELARRVAVLEKLKEMQTQSWLGWSKSLAFGTFEYFAPVVGYTYMSHVLDKIFHEDSIEWCIGVQTRLHKHMENLTEYAQGFDKALSYDEKKQLYARSLVGCANGIVHDLEYVLGYMNYKQEQLEGQAHMDAQLNNACLHKTVDTFASKLQVYLNDYFKTPTTDKVAPLIQDFKQEYERIVASFEQLEYELA